MANLLKSGKTKPSNPLPNSGHIQGAVCVQWRKSGESYRPYYYRFWRESGRLRKQYIRLADVEEIRSACEDHRRLQKAWRAEFIRARKLCRSLIDILKNETTRL